MTPPDDSPIIPHTNGGKMGRIRPGTRMTVRRATKEERAHEEKRILDLSANSWDDEVWLGHAWFVVFADDPEKVLFDWFSPVGGRDEEGARREAEKYARARGATVV